jgi:hypothetical protein
VQIPREIEERKKKKIVFGDKLGFLSVHEPYIHRGDAETKLKQPQNGLSDR